MSRSTWSCRLPVNSAISRLDMNGVVVAEELGVSQPTVHADLSEKNVRTQKPDKEPRQRTRYEISQYTKPETAARRIREVFGDEFAASLAISLRPQ